MEELDDNHDHNDHNHEDHKVEYTVIPTEWDKFLLMPRFSNIDLLNQITTFSEAKHLFLYTYALDDELAYQIVDMINETYLKLLDQYTSDSI